MIYFEISTHPVYYGSDVTPEESHDWAEYIAERLSEMYPNAMFDVVNDTPRKECLPEEEDELAAICKMANDNLVDWIQERERKHRPRARPPHLRTLG